MTYATMVTMILVFVGGGDQKFDVPLGICLGVQREWRWYDANGGQYRAINPGRGINVRVSEVVCQVLPVDATEGIPAS